MIASTITMRIGSRKVMTPKPRTNFDPTSGKAPMMRCRSHERMTKIVKKTTLPNGPMKTMLVCSTVVSKVVW